MDELLEVVHSDVVGALGSNNQLVGDSVYDILIEAARKYNIQMENNGSADMVYISGINYLYEFDFGDLSGWVYHVNGIAPSVGCGEYVLSDGDTIEWLYTCNLGNDIK